MLGHIYRYHWSSILMLTHILISFFFLGFLEFPSFLLVMFQFMER